MIRSLTIGLPINAHSPHLLGTMVREFEACSRETLKKSGIAARTVRFTLPPFVESDEMEGAMLGTLKWVNDLAHSTGARWFCAPIDLVTPARRRERLATALNAVTRFESMFVNLVVAQEGKIAINGANDAAKFIIDVSKKSNNGFDNFRVGASLNCPANAPFFPFSRHEGETLAFSLALETTEIALAAVADLAAARCHDIDIAIEKIVVVISEVLGHADAIGKRLASATGAVYRGLDASFAPLPDGKTSVAHLVEQLVGAPFGSRGSLFVTALLTDVLREATKRSGARAVGFNGVMFSLLEDNHLAVAASRRAVSLDGLGSLAAVCGCGIDMVPVPGNSFAEEIAAVILDMAALSTALGKPLGVRLLPIPNRRENEFTEFNQDFLCDSRVLGLTANDHRFRASGETVRFRSPLRSF